MIDGPWYEHAACSGMDTNLFFPLTGRGSGPARRICARCPVADACLADAADFGRTHGIWGGRMWTEGRMHEGTGGRTQPCTPDQRARGIELYRQQRPAHKSHHATLNTVGKMLGVTDTTVQDWVRDALDDDARGSGEYAQTLARRRADGLAMLRNIRHQHPTTAAAYREVAAAHGVSVDTVRYWAAQARKQQQNTLGRAA